MVYKEKAKRKYNRIYIRDRYRYGHGRAEHTHIHKKVTQAKCGKMQKWQRQYVGRLLWW